MTVINLTLFTVLFSLACLVALFPEYVASSGPALRRRAGAVVRALVSHQCGPGSILRFDSQIRREMWVEFIGSLLCTERFSPGTPVSPLLKRPPFDLI